MTIPRETAEHRGTPTSIRGVRTVTVPVSDHGTALDFFVDTLGFEVRIDVWASPTMRWAEVAPPGSAVTLALVGREPGTRGVDTGIRFAVPDAELEHDSLRGKDVRIGEVLRWHGVPPMFTVEDPDGNRFVVVEDRR